MRERGAFLTVATAWVLDLDFRDASKGIASASVVASDVDVGDVVGDVGDTLGGSLGGTFGDIFGQVAGCEGAGGCQLIAAASGRARSIDNGLAALDRDECSSVWVQASIRRSGGAAVHCR